MAVIHHGKNRLQEKLDLYYEECMDKARKYHAEAPVRFQMRLKKEREEHEWLKKQFRRELPVKILIVLGALLMIAALIMFPGVIRTVQDAAKGLFTWLEDALRNAMRDAMMQQKEDLLAILLDLLLAVLSFIAAVLLWIFKILSPVLVFVLFYAVPVLIGFFTIRSIDPPGRFNGNQTFTPTPFDEEAERENIINDRHPAEIETLKAGIEGEEKALASLSEMGKSCHLYTNLLIPHAGRISETDIIAVTPQAVTIVEVKNYKNDLVGDWSDRTLWIETERGRETHRREVGNPIGQVSTHARRLQGFLSDNGMNVRVKKCVLFINRDISLFDMTDRNGALQDCPVFRYYEIASLMTYLQTSNGASPPKALSRMLTEMAAEQAAGNIPHADPVSLDSFDGIIYNEDEEAYVTMPINPFEDEDEEEEQVYYSPYPISDDTGE